MERRSQRHINKPIINESKNTRTNKNKYLYDEINNKIGYEEISKLTDVKELDLSQIVSNEDEKEDEYIKEDQTINKQEEKKVYDINSILEEAKKNRIKYDELEKKRKLRENDYATLADVNKINSKKEYKEDIDEKELTNLINTITSHNLAEEIKKASENQEENNEDIFSELLATNIDLNLEEGIAKEFTEEHKKEDIDDSFYTKSMDLSEHDFEFSEELEKEKQLKIKIIIVVVIILLLIGVIAFFILKQKGIL